MANGISMKRDESALVWVGRRKEGRQGSRWEGRTEGRLCQQPHKRNKPRRVAAAEKSMVSRGCRVAFN